MVVKGVFTFCANYYRKMLVSFNSFIFCLCGLCSNCIKTAKENTLRSKGKLVFSNFDINYRERKKRK